MSNPVTEKPVEAASSPPPLPPPEQSPPPPPAPAAEEQEGYGDMEIEEEEAPQPSNQDDIMASFYSSLEPEAPPISAEQEPSPPLPPRELSLAPRELTPATASPSSSAPSSPAPEATKAKKRKKVKFLWNLYIAKTFC